MPMKKGSRRRSANRLTPPPQPSWWAALLAGAARHGARPSPPCCCCRAAWAGATCSRRAAAEPGANPELSQLRGQVESLRQLVALSLLQEQSASARLRGVNYSYQMTQPDREVQQALLHAVNHDTNVNVRLSAVDALAKFADRARGPARAGRFAAGAGFAAGADRADRPAGAVERARRRPPPCSKLAQQADANESVRQRAAAAYEKLGGIAMKRLAV